MQCERTFLFDSTLHVIIIRNNGNIDFLSTSHIANFWHARDGILELFPFDFIKQNEKEINIEIQDRVNHLFLVGVSIWELSIMGKGLKREG